MSIAPHAPARPATPPHAATHEAQELGAFLRRRRESIAPAQLGLPGSQRKRTPGLRREDVAALANIGTTWYTKLEQGRGVRASAKVLGAIAAALQCSVSETQHVFALAGIGAPAGTTPRPVCEQISAANQLLLDQLDPLPALIQNARFEILGYNQAYCRLVNVDLASIAPEYRNCIDLALNNANWRASLGDLDDALPRMVALFRAAMAEHLHEPVWEQLLQRYLSTSAEFRQLWQRYEVRSIENQIKRFHHARWGSVDLQQSNWWSTPANGNRMLVYLPTDQHSRACLWETPAPGTAG